LGFKGHGKPFDQKLVTTAGFVNTEKSGIQAEIIEAA
jgi:hypothetical protein